MIDKLQDFFEKYAFGVCEWWGQKLGLKSNRIRLFFIYLSFLSFGSTVVVYLIMAFILEHKDFFKLRSRKTIWDL